MGWSGYNPRFQIMARVDAHGGEREEKGEELYAKFVSEVDSAIVSIILKPDYAHPEWLALSFDSEQGYITNSPA